MTKLKIVLSAVALLAIGFGLGVYGHSLLVNKVAPGASGGGPVEYTAKHFVGDVYNGMNDVLMMSAGVFVGQINSAYSNTFSSSTNITGLLTLGGNNCTTFSWDPAAISSSTSASTSVAFAGSLLSDLPISALETASSPGQWVMSASFGPAGSSSVVLQAVPSAAVGSAWVAGLDLVTTTVRVCKVK